MTEFYGNRPRRIDLTCDACGESFSVTRRKTDMAQFGLPDRCLTCRAKEFAGMLEDDEDA